MPKRTLESDAIRIDLQDNGDFTSELRSNLGRYVRVTKVGDAQSPRVEGDDSLTSNPAIVTEFWLATVAHIEASELESQIPAMSQPIDVDRAKELRSQAQEKAKYATKLAELSDLVTGEEEEGYCSACLQFVKHRTLSEKGLYLCKKCGNATAHCKVPKCENFGVASFGLLSGPVFCAEHLHQVPDFSKLDLRIDDLTQFKELQEYRVMNINRTAKLAMAGTVALAAATPLGFAAAPAIGGAIGTTFLGLTGAAATNAGLAALGMGSLAAGGLGMAGGTLVVAAAGGMLGSAAGVRALSAYLGDDDSFNITKVRDGSGVPVLILRGFLTEGKLSWRTEVRAVESAYPDSPIYTVEWGSKELKELSGFAGFAAGGGAGMVAKSIVRRASKKVAKNLPVAGAALGAIDLISNPWHTAVNRANSTAMALAAILQRTNIDECVVIGHSLGGRVALNLALAMAGVEDESKKVRLRAVHVLGGAIGQQGSWSALASDSIGEIHNYFSINDGVLGKLYPVAMLTQKAVGAVGIASTDPKVVNHNVSNEVQSHTKYYENVTLVVD